MDKMRWTHFLCCSIQSEVEPICKCGFPRSSHDPSLSSGSSAMDDWKVDSHTRSVRTNAFGTVEFLGFGENERNVSILSIVASKMTY